MKICYLGDASSIHTWRWARYFSKKGYEIEIISFKSPCFDFKNIKIHLIEKPIKKEGIFFHFLNFPFLLLKTKEKLKEIQPDILHILGGTGAWIMAFLDFHPYLLTIAGPSVLPVPPQKKLPKIYQILNRIALKKPDLITTDGENTKEAMIKLGASPKKIRIIRFGVDVEKFKPKEKNLELLPKDWQNCKIVISTKPLRRESDIETLIRAVPLILKEVPKTRFLICGEGEKKKELENLAKSLNVSNKIKFLGKVSEDDLPDYLNLADMFVSTSLVDSGIAASTAEAMACGIPLVISDSGDNKLFIKEGENGFLFPLKEYRILAGKVVSLLKNEDLWQKFYLSHRNWIEENNNYEKEMAKMEKIYLEFKK